jgi:hypothetical protein
MEPFTVLTRLLGLNRHIAIYLFSGLGLLAAIAIASSWGIDEQTAMLMGVYFIGLTTTLFIFASLVRDRLIQRVLAWFIALMIILSILVLFISAVIRDQTVFPPPYCLVRFYEMCPQVAEQIAERTTSPPVGVTPPAPPPAIEASQYTVYVQFAGIISRDSVRTMMTGLAQSGWNVQGVKGGGERIGSAAGRNEIRYGREEDRAAAEALARAVEAYGLALSNVRAVSVPSITAKKLEVWISR